MANSFWNFVTTFTAGTLAKAEDVNTNFTGVQTGLDLVEAEINKAIQVTNSPGTTDITLNAAARALKIITFDASGNIAAVDDIGDWQGNHANAAGTDYNIRDLVKDAAASIGLNNIYRCNTVHTSTGGLAADTANWDLVIDVTDAVTAQVAAELAETNAAASAAAALVSENNAAAYAPSWTVKTSAYTAVAGNDIAADTATTGAFQIDLPAGVVNDTIRFTDYANNFATANLTITPDGAELIEGLNENLVVSTNKVTFTLTYIDATRGWIVTEA